MFHIRIRHVSKNRPEHTTQLSPNLGANWLVLSEMVFSYLLNANLVVW